MADIAPGTSIPVEILRQGQRLTLTAVVAKRPSQDDLAKTFAQPEAKGDPFDNASKNGAGPVNDALGLQVLDMSPDIAQQLRVPATTRGAVIAGVDSASDAANNGLQRGDVVVSVNFKPIGDAAAFDAAIRAAKSGGRPSVTLEILRPNQPGTVYVALRLR